MWRKERLSRSTDAYKRENLFRMRKKGSAEGISYNPSRAATEIALIDKLTIREFNFNRDSRSRRARARARYAVGRLKSVLDERCGRNVSRSPDVRAARAKTCVFRRSRAWDTLLKSAFETMRTWKYAEYENICK